MINSKKIMSNNNNLTQTPFLKWAGGKRWLVSSHSELFPANYNRYIEPFLGSGAVFFHLNPKKAILADCNSALIDTYKAIKKDWKAVQREITKHHNNHDNNYYYKIRSSKPKLLHTKAAKFIYLNRTCWNGLYRVNLKGEFNVPIGTKTDVLLESDNFEEISKQLNRASLRNCDFEKIIETSERNDLLFIDPPYTVKHNRNNFIKYNEKLFSWDDQIRLRDALVIASKRGVKIIVTNADHNCIHNLYKDFGSFTKLIRNSIIAADSTKRKKCGELIISKNV